MLLFIYLIRCFSLCGSLWKFFLFLLRYHRYGSDEIVLLNVDELDSLSSAAGLSDVRN